MPPERYGIVWYKDRQVYFREFRRLRRWKGRERAMIRLPGGREVKVDVSHVRRWPGEDNNEEQDREGD